MDEQYELEEQIEIDLRGFAASFLRGTPLIAAFTLVFGLAAFIYSNWFIPPTYSTNVKFYVNNQQGISSSIKVQSADVTTSNTLVHGYVAMLKTDRVLEEVAVNANLGYSAAQLSAMISASSVENTPIFVVTVKSAEPAHAQKIANVVADIAPSLIQEVVKGSSVEIIDRAKLPVKPVSPDVKRITLLGFLAGFVLCSAGVFIAARLDTRVKSADELSARFERPVLGIIPRISSKAGDKKLFKKSTAEETDARNSGRILGSADNGFEVREAYNTLHTNLVFSIPRKACRKITVTSPCEGDGKSTTAINLALSIAKGGARALLIDCDLRRPNVARLLSLPNGKGLSDLLAGCVDAESALKKNVRENMDIISAGTIPPNPTELLGSDAFEAMVEELAKSYDYIILDTPPVNPVSDPAIVSRAADGAVMVVNINRTSMVSVKSAVKALQLADSKLLGFVINGCAEKKYGYYASREDK